MATMPEKTNIKKGINMLQNTTITINDNPITLNQKLAQIEANAIIEEFLKDFGFDLLALPSLDLPLKQYEQALIEREKRKEVTND